EDPIPHDLADSDDEDLANLNIDDGVNMSADVARGHGCDGGGDDRPPPYQIRAPKSPIWVAGERAGCIPARRPETPGYRPSQIRVALSRSGLRLMTERPSCLSVTMQLIGPTTSGSSLGSCPCTTLLGAKCQRSERLGSWQRLE
nr:hypothetical protein [Tanacetum cinerariifolium]